MAIPNKVYTIDKGLQNTWEQQYIVGSGTSASIGIGVPSKCTTSDGSVAGVVAVMADGDGLVTGERFAGLAKRTSTETAGANGVVGVYAPVPGILYRGFAKSAAAADTQSEINALMGKKVLFDLTSSDWTVDTAATDALVNCVVIAGGLPQTSEILFVYSPKGTIFDTSTSI
jgi:hypothetical protein